MYNYNHLYYFFVTAKAGGVMKASKHLRISQPSLSSQLKILESNLGVKLFQRVGRSNELTRQGLAVYGYCQRMFDWSEEMSEALLKTIPSATRIVYIGASEKIERTLVVDAVSFFLREFSPENRPQVILISGAEDALTARLRFRELDLIILESMTKDPELINLTSVSSPVLLALPHQITKKTVTKDQSLKQTLEKLNSGASLDWVMPSNRFKLRAEIDYFFERNQLKGRIILESDVLASLARAVVDQIGIGFFPLFYVARERQERRLGTIGPDEGFWSYQIWLSCNQQSQNDQLIISFSMAFKSVSQNLNTNSNNF